MKIDLVRCHHATQNSPTAAVRQFKRERGLVKDPCSYSAKTKLIAKFKKTGRVLNESRGRLSLQEELETAVEDAVADSDGKRLSEEFQLKQIFRLLLFIAF